MIGERIKNVRELNGFTQSSLAKKLGISRSAVNAWELGISVPSAQYLIALSKLFNISSDYLLELNSKETVDISSLTDEEKQIIYYLLSYYKKYGDTLRNFNKQVKANCNAIKDVSEKITNQAVKNILEEVISLNETID